MADPVFREDLFPLALVANREVSNGDTTIRTPMVSGRAIVRKTYESVPASIQVSWLFKDAQVAAAFEAWVAGVLNNGERWFLMPIQLPAGRGPWRVRLIGQYLGPRMVGPNMWQIDATLEIYVRPIIGSEWGEFPEFIIGASIIDLAVNQEWPQA